MEICPRDTWSLAPQQPLLRRAHPGSVGMCCHPLGGHLALQVKVEQFVRTSSRARALSGDPQKRVFQRPGTKGALLGSQNRGQWSARPGQCPAADLRRASAGPSYSSQTQCGPQRLPHPGNLFLVLTLEQSGCSSPGPRARVLQVMGRAQSVGCRDKTPSTRPALLVF